MPKKWTLSFFAIIFFIAAFTLPDELKAYGTNPSLNCQPPLACALDKNSSAYHSNRSKSPGRAVLYGVGFTAVPSLISGIVDNDIGIWFLIGGLTMGPSAGLLYANDIDRALKGFYLRSASTMVTLAGVVVIALEALGGNSDSILGATMIVGGVSVLGVSTAYDIFRAGPQAVDAYNQEHSGSTFALAPWLSPQGTGGGLRFGISF